MFILSNKNLLIALAMVACFATAANAEQDVRRKLRGSADIAEEIQEVVDGRVLKKKTKKKKRKDKNRTQATTLNSNFGFVGNANNFGNNVAKPVGHVQMFEDKCPSTPKMQALEGCVGNNFGNIQACKQCLISKQTLNLADANNRIRSCFNAAIPGFCTPNCDVEAYQYFGCGTGQPDLGVPVTTPVVTNPVIVTPGGTIPVVTTPIVTTPVITTPVATTPVATTPVATTPAISTGSGMTTSVTATATASTPGEAPANICPTTSPGSGISCDLQGYDSMTCWYPGYTKCVCGSLSPIFLCTDES
eukprot:CAMPEP_0116133074 /NCGR_PEP_ID=MMETSP0329-20121206/9907_1 /TAXON_ID=697910 /ORGANISM="Pseudo-nitzschia arenysensis, Strain B593" /LENGTH=303 /DNA_ID=CAMNT_0003627671 /DNA_START=65 /DNA_END=976 /DNA_ORIENTATION=-